MRHAHLLPDSNINWDSVALYSFADGMEESGLNQFCQPTYINVQDLYMREYGIRQEHIHYLVYGFFKRKNCLTSRGGLFSSLL